MDSLFVQGYFACTGGGDSECVSILSLCEDIRDFDKPDENCDSTFTSGGPNSDSDTDGSDGDFDDSNTESHGARLKRMKDYMAPHVPQKRDLRGLFQSKAKSIAVMSSLTGASDVEDAAQTGEQ